MVGKLNIFPHSIGLTTSGALCAFFSIIEQGTDVENERWASGHQDSRLNQNFSARLPTLHIIYVILFAAIRKMVGKLNIFPHSIGLTTSGALGAFFPIIELGTDVVFTTRRTVFFLKRFGG